MHGAFVADHEVHAVVRHLKKSGTPRYIDEILEGPASPTPGLTGIDPAPIDASDAEQDPLYDQAVQVPMVHAGTCSVHFCWTGVLLPWH